MGPRNLVLSLALSLSTLGAGCSSSPTGPVPGSHPPGASCSKANDCYCWSCVCEGVSGLPGQAQLCVDDTCPSGEEACATSCSVLGTKVASATSVDTCNGVP